MSATIQLKPEEWRALIFANCNALTYQLQNQIPESLVESADVCLMINDRIRQLILAWRVSDRPTVANGEDHEPPPAPPKGKKQRNNKRVNV